MMPHRTKVHAVLWNIQNILPLGRIAQPVIINPIKFLGIVAVILITLPACTGLPAVQAPQAATAPEAATADEEITVIYGYGAEAVTLDAAEAIDGPSFDVIFNIHEGLVALAENGEIVPALATDWTLSDDQLAWTFNLQEGVKFQDGTAFNAEAVKFNFDRILNPDLALANLGQWEPHIDSIEVIDEYVVQIKTKAPYGSLLNLLASDFGKFMNSPTAVEASGEEYSRNPVGTGPFMFDSWLPGERLTLKKNPDYWREGPFIDRVEFRPIPEGSARLLALEGGDVDLVNQVPAQDLQRLEEDPDIEVMYKTISRLFYWAFNNSKEIWADPNVRIALNHAIDRQSIVDNILFGVGDPANSFISPTVYGSIPIDVFEYDPEKARQMLEEANFPFDTELTVYVTEGRYYQDRQTAEAMQGMLAEIGVNFNVEVLEWGAFVDAIWFTEASDPVAQARDAMQTSFGSDDPPTWMRQTLISESWPPIGFNEALYSNPEVDRLIEAVNETTDLDERRQLLGDIQRELIADPPWIISHFEQAVIAHKAELQDLTIIPTGRVNFRLAKVNP